MRLPTVLLVLHFLDNGYVTLLGEAKVCGIADGFPQDQKFHFNPNNSGIFIDKFVEAKNSSVSHSVFVIWFIALLMHIALVFARIWNCTLFLLHVYSVCQQLVQDCMLF